MAKAVAGRRWVVWLALAAMVAVLIALGSPVTATPAEEAEADLDADARLKVAWVQPVQAAPGHAVVAMVEGLDPALPVTATLSQEGQKMPAEVLQVQDGRVAVRLPESAQTGVVKLRLHQGETRSKPRLVQVAEPALWSKIRLAVAGIAALLVGLTMVARSLQRSAGRPLRTVLARLTGSGARRIALGAGLGLVTQTTTGVAGITGGLARARLIPQAAGPGMLLGSQLGVALGAMFIPLIGTQHALWLLALGFVQRAFARTRMTRSLAKAVLGLGLIGLGLYVLQLGLAPLLSEPALLPLIHAMSGPGWLADLQLVLLGVGLGALFQGPGPALLVVAALCEGTALVPVSSGFLMLAGVAMGPAVAALPVHLVLGRAGRRLALVHTLICVLCGLSVGALIPVWEHLGAPYFTESPGTPQFGQALLRPGMSLQLSVGFFASQLLATLLGAPLLRPLMSLAERLLHGTVEAPPSAGQDMLYQNLQDLRASTDLLQEIIHTGRRRPAAEIERLLSQVRQRALPRTTDGGKLGAIGPSYRSALTASVLLAGAVESAVRTAERGLERDLTVGDSDEEPATLAYHLVAGGLHALLDHMAGKQALVTEQLQVRELKLNALEARVRTSPDLVAGFEQALYQSELVSAAEVVGNHVFRIGQALLRHQDDVRSGAHGQAVVAA